MLRYGRVLLLAAIALYALAACAPQPNELQDTVDLDGAVAGFWLGLWHGFITPFTFVISLFSSSVGIYEAHNNGGWYNFGFLIGASVMLGGSGRASHSHRRRSDR